MTDKGLLSIFFSTSLLFAFIPTIQIFIDFIDVAFFPSFFLHRLHRHSRYGREEEREMEKKET